MPKKIGNLDGKDIYRYANGELAIERDHARLCFLTKDELKKWRVKCEKGGV